MPDVQDRDELEEELARKLARLQRKQMKRLLAELGDPPIIQNLSPMFWYNASRELMILLEPILAKIYLKQAREMRAEVVDKLERA